MLVAASVGGTAGSWRLFVRPAGTAAEVSAFIRGAGDSMLPVIGKVGGSVDRENGQLDKVDRITDCAVDGQRERGFLDELREVGT